MSYSAPWTLEERREREPLESWVARLACIRYVSPRAMTEHLLSAPWRTDGIPEPRDVTLLRTRDPREGKRRFDTTSPIGAYCPLCFSGDCHAHRLPAFDSEWQYVWRTHCTIHLTPLFKWPYRDFDGEIVLWRWWSDVLSHRRTGPRLDDRSRQFCTHLQLARRVRFWSNAGDGRALAWKQQVELERVLSGQLTGASVAIAGLTIADMRRSVQALACFLANEFGSGLRCQASHLASFLGPPWMFSRRFDHGVQTTESAVVTLGAFSDPAQRRTLIALAVKILASFAADLSFDARGVLSDVGHTGLIHDLRHAHPAAWRWAARQVSRWPSVVAMGMRNAGASSGAFVSTPPRVSPTKQR
jgi:hypothetical protein